MSVVETVVVFGVIPVAAMIVFALLVLLRRPGVRPRYRSGEAWEHPPVWWSGNPMGIAAHGADNAAGHGRHASRHGVVASPVGGGARGTW